MAISPISSTSGVAPVNPVVVQNARDSLETNANQLTPAAQQRQQMEAQLESYTQQLAQAQAAIAQYTQSVQQIQQQMVAVQQQLGLADVADTNLSAQNAPQLNQQNSLNNPLSDTNALDRLNLNNPLNTNSLNTNSLNRSDPLNLAEANNSILGATLGGNNAAGVPGISTLTNTAIANSIIPPLNTLPESGAAVLEENSTPPAKVDSAGKQIDTLI